MSPPSGAAPAFTGAVARQSPTSTLSLAKVRWRKAVWEARGLGRTSRLVAYTLAEYMDRDGRGAYPSVATLADKADMSERTAFTHLAKLVKAGWLERVERPRVNGRQASYEYRATIPARVKGLLSGQTATDDKSRLQNQTAKIAEDPLEDLELVKTEQGSLSKASPLSPPKAKSAGEKKRANTSFPADFKLSAKDYKFSESLGFDRDETIERTRRLKDHALANNWRRADWRAQWREWMRGAVRLDPPEPHGWSGDYGGVNEDFVGWRG